MNDFKVGDIITGPTASHPSWVYYVADSSEEEYTVINIEAPWYSSVFAFPYSKGYLNAYYTLITSILRE